MEPFMYYDENDEMWYIGINHDHCDVDGNFGMTTEIVAGPFDNKFEAELALIKNEAE